MEDKKLQTFSLLLSGPDDKKGSFEFNVRNHPAARHWSRCLYRACRESEIHEGDRWYNFNKNTYGSFEKLSCVLNRVIDQLNEVEPELITERVELGDIQRSVNSLHVNFADNHLVKKRINERNKGLWADFNNLLHGFETLERSQKVEWETGMKNRSIIFTWKNNFVEPLDENEYSEFTVGKIFGTIYINYCQVGRHILEMYLAQDDLAQDEHIRPLSKVSADSYLWLGPSSGKSGIEKKMAGIKNWFLKNKERLNGLGYYWGDSKLAIGWIPVADLKLPTETQNQKMELVNEFEQYDSVRGVEFSD